jgi:hypothetical protein
MRAAACAAAAFTLAWLATAPVSAQWENWPMKNVPRLADGKVDMKAPPRRTADGKIDLQGFWLPTNPVKHLLNLAADLKPVTCRCSRGPRRSCRSGSRRTARITPAYAAGPPEFPRSSTFPTA